MRDSAAEGVPTSGRAVILATIGLRRKKARTAVSRLQAKAVRGTGIQAPVASSGFAVNIFGSRSIGQRDERKQPPRSDTDRRAC